MSKVRRDNLGKGFPKKEKEEVGVGRRINEY